MKSHIQQAWEYRSHIWKDNRKSVLEQSYPEVVNRHIHNLHVEEIEHAIQKKYRVCLDVGCGYGRIAQELVARNKGIFIHGVDLSRTFVTLFNQKLGGRGKAVVSDMRSLPYKANTFDYIYVVTAFMYLSGIKDQRKAMREIFRTLKPGGTALFVEPNKFGVWIIRLGGIVPFIYRRLLKRKKTETFGISFPWGRIDTLIEQHGRIMDKRGYPMLTIMLLPSVLLGKILPDFVHKILDFCRSLDEQIRYSRFSYVITYRAVKSSR